MEWALAPDRGALGYQTGSLAARMASGHLRGPWAQELKSSHPRQTGEGGEAGGRVLAGLGRDSLGASACSPAVSGSRPPHLAHRISHCFAHWIVTVLSVVWRIKKCALRTFKYYVMDMVCRITH